MTLNQHLAYRPELASFFEHLAPSYQARYQNWLAAAKTPADAEARLRHIDHELTKRHQVLKIGSYMGDIRAPDPKHDAPRLRAQLIEASELLTHKQMVQYAIALCHHVAARCDLSTDATLLATIAINQQWLADEISFKEAREFAGVPMQKSRNADTTSHRLFYRMCHQAALTPHVKRHALIASDFTIEALHAADPTDMQVATSERQWQLDHILRR